MMSKVNSWWGEFQFSEGQIRYWSLAERKIVIQRHSSEWNTWNVETNQENTYPSIDIECSTNDVLDSDLMARHLQKTTPDKLLVQPALADRPVVARPSVPLRLLGGEKALIYVSTPLWFQAMMPNNNTCILDIPFWRPSDSWFGPSTIDGELCYAKYTDARFKLESLEQRPHRAITPIQIHNKQQQVLTIERLNVPVPLLNLYGEVTNALWTNTINVTREENDDIVELHLEKKAPKNISNAALVGNSRIKGERHMLIRTISSLFA